MDPKQLSKFFPENVPLDADTQRAIYELQTSARIMADTIQRLLPESQKKFDLHMGLLSIVREAEFALRLDGPSRTSPMIVTKQ